MVHRQDFYKITFGSVDNSIVSEENLVNARVVELGYDFAGIGEVSQAFHSGQRVHGEKTRIVRGVGGNEICDCF